MHTTYHVAFYLQNGHTATFPTALPSKCLEWIRELCDELARDTGTPITGFFPLKCEIDTWSQSRETGRWYAQALRNNETIWQLIDKPFLWGPIRDRNCTCSRCVERRGE